MLIIFIGSFHGSSHGVHPSSCSPVQPSLSRNSAGLTGTSLDSSRLQQNSNNSQVSSVDMRFKSLFC